jgi:replicative DNA helicase
MATVEDLVVKLPPQNLDAERSVLGSMLLSNDAVDEVASFLKAAHFYHDAHQQIYGAICRMREQGRGAIDAVTLAEELTSLKLLEDIGGPNYLHQILETVPHAAHVRYYADIVHEKHVQRTLIETCTQVLRDAYDAARPADDILQEAEQKIFSILEQQERDTKLSIRDILVDAFTEIDIRLQREGEISGLPTTFVDFDRLTTGFQPAELVILAARPSMGKTALLCNWTECIARPAGPGKPSNGVLIFSLEQSKLELAERFLCMVARVDGHRLRNGEIDAEEQQKLLDASAQLNELPIFIDDTPARSTSQIGAIARRMKRQHDIKLIVIDYLQLIEPEDRRAPREQQISQMTRRLKQLAKEINIPLIALAQLNRGVDLREDKRPRLADLRESGAIEQDADLVIFLHRPDAYDPNDRANEADLIIAKHRSGPTGTVNLTWRKEFLRFESGSRRREPAGFSNDGDYRIDY